MMRLPAVYFVLLLLACSNKEKTGTTVNFSFIPFYKEKIYLEKIPFANEEWQVLDSFQLTYATDKVSFTIPPQEESVFQLRIEGKPVRITFINDVPEVNISSKAPDARDHVFNNGGVNPYLRKFLLENRSLEEELGKLATEANKYEISSSKFNEQTQQRDSIYNILQQRAKHFIDTTSSPAAFLLVYNRIEFGKDFKALKETVTKAGDRFPKHKGVQKLKAASIKIAGIFEKEYNIGDVLPTVSLMDLYDKPFSTESLKGKLVFIDLWSTWCGQCLKYINAKQELNKTLGTKLNLVSIVLDDQKQNWKTMVQQYQIPGVHLIDEEMWQGKAAEAYKMDSIPFNFLISPEGKILAKAIKPDSVLQVVTSFISSAKQ